jgi:hypothetical protein
VEILPQPALNQTTYYAATSVGLYSTTALSNGTTWIQEGQGSIGNVVVDDIEARNEDGRVLAGTHGNGVYTSTVTVPVELADFDVVAKERVAELTWTTSSETNNAGFRITHRYRDGKAEKMGFVEGNGTTTQAHTYRYRTDDLSPGPHTFRLRQVDTDGTSNQLETQTITISPSGTFELAKLSPNPFERSTTTRLTTEESQHVRATVYNSIGQQVRTVLDREVQANAPIDLSINGDRLASGVYFLQVQGETFEATRKMVLAR